MTEPEYVPGTIVRDKKWSYYTRVVGHEPLVWQILATGDRHADRVFKGELRDDAHPIRPLTVIPAEDAPR